jgi:hypothetical protein
MLHCFKLQKETFKRRVIMKQNRLLEFLRSTPFVLYVAIFSVLFLAPNTYYVFYKFCVFNSPFRELASLGVSIIVASSVMIYTLRKNFRMAKFYSLFEVAISAYYYSYTIGTDWDLLPAFCFTLILPISVYYYTLEIDKPLDGNNEMDSLKDIVNEKSLALNSLMDSFIQLEEKAEKEKKFLINESMEIASKYNQLNADFKFLEKQNVDLIEGSKEFVINSDDKIKVLSDVIADQNEKIINLNDDVTALDHLNDELKEHNRKLFEENESLKLKNPNIPVNENKKRKPYTSGNSDIVLKPIKPIQRKKPIKDTPAPESVQSEALNTVNSAFNELNTSVKSKRPKRVKKFLSRE